jgi:6,7-dimethyl-8-ribityllumazine synthase
MAQKFKRDMMSDLKERLEESGCSSEFIADALRYKKLYEGDIDDFIDRVEEILMGDDGYEEEDDEDYEDDPIYTSDYNYEGNDDNIYFEDGDGEEAFEEDDDEDY